MELESLFGPTLDFVFFLLPIVIPIVLIYTLFEMWVKFARERFMSSQEYVLIRITPPRDFFKTPLAMELFINALYQTSGESTPVDRLYYGKVRAWFSLEIASHEGEVAFYIWSRKSLAGFIQNQIYAQYPGVEVKEVEDYVSKIDYDSGKYSMFGLEYTLSQPDPLPIKTYVDYGLDKAETKDELKIDPITPTIEFLGSLKQGEHAWIQIIVRAHKKEDKDKTKWFGKTDYWIDDAKQIIKDIRIESVYENAKGDLVPLATKGQGDKINAIERSVSKLGFDCGIRSIYIADKDVFSGVNIPGLVGCLKQYGSASLNSFRPQITTSFDYFWQDFTGSKLKRYKKEIFEAFKARDYFWRKFEGDVRKKFILNSEELATIYHFPGADVQTPTLTRVQSRKGNAPSNLPI
jgi:hypothetical protein